MQIATKTTTSALLNAAGDVLSQLFFEEGEGFNWKRTLTFGFLVGPGLGNALQKSCIACEGG